MRGGERRIAHRLHLQLTGTVTHEDDEDKFRNPVTTKDISAYGAYLLTERCPSAGERVKLTLHWPVQYERKKTQFEASGTVLRVDEFPEGNCGFAVRFEELPSLLDQEGGLN